MFFSCLVTLSGPTFRGIFLQVRDGSDLATSSAVGTWSAPSSDYRTLDCFMSDDSALGHANRNDKSFSGVTFQWTPPDVCDENTTYEIRLETTFVQLCRIILSVSRCFF